MISLFKDHMKAKLFIRLENNKAEERNVKFLFISIYFEQEYTSPIYGLYYITILQKYYLNQDIYNRAKHII